MTVARALAALLFIAPSLIVPSAARAQFDSTSFEVHAGYYDWSGDSVDPLEGGVRLQGAALGEIRPRISLGATFLYGWSGIEGAPDDDLTEVGAGVITRFSFGAPDGTRLLMDANLAWSLLRFSPGGGPIAAVQENGLAIGPSLGVSIPIAEDIRLHLSGGATYNKYGDLQFAQGVGTGTEGSSGWHYGVRVGLGFAGD